MRNTDFSPFYRSTVGYDRLFNLLDTVADNGQTGYPPYNIEKTGDDAYLITVAVAGFAEDELSIEARDGQLVVSGKKSATEREPSYLHRGIATRAFEKRFQLADHVRALGARTENGLLHIELVREVPEALKPRRVEIQSAKALSAQTVSA